MNWSVALRDHWKVEPRVTRLMEISMNTDSEPMVKGKRPIGYPDSTTLALMALTMTGLLAFGLPMMLGGHGGGARYTSYAGIVTMYLGFLLMGLRGRRRTSALWGIQTDGLLFRAGYGVYVGAFATCAIMFFITVRDSFDLAVTRADVGEPALPSSMDKLSVTLSALLVWFALILLDLAYLRYLRGNSAAKPRPSLDSGDKRL